jgi:rRNA maturation RNase YbeY
MGWVRRLDPDTEWSEVTVILADDAGIADVNRRVFGRDNPTDVISLRYPPVAAGDHGVTCEVIVNVQRAWDEGMRRRSRPRTWGPNQEFALYIAHGCDHLSGADDAGMSERRRMRRRELRWVREAEHGGLVGGLVHRV